MSGKYLKKLKRYVFGTGNKTDLNGYSLDFPEADVSAHACTVAEEIRGEDRKPAIIIHGVMPRSGTVYVGELLRLHPDLQAYPNDIWEFPFLQLTGTLDAAQEQFFKAYKYNMGKIGEDDFLQIFGASIIAYLYKYLPSDKRLLIKVPDVCYLNYFETVFPNENLLLLMRDGRDVVSSTIRTWPKKKFSDACIRWDLSAKIALKYDDVNGGEKNGFLLARYEDAFKDPVSFVTDACNYMGLDVNRYPFDKMDEIRVIGSSSHKKDGKVTWEGEGKPKDFKTQGRWEDWSEKDKDTFKKIAGESLIKSGYCDNLDW